MQELLKNCEAEVATTYAKTLRSKPEVDDQPSEAAGKVSQCTGADAAEQVREGEVGREE